MYNVEWRLENTQFDVISKKREEMIIGKKLCPRLRRRIFPGYLVFN